MQHSALRAALAAVAIGAAAWLMPAKAAPKAEKAPAPITFEAGKGAFLLNGEPYVVKAAELHYPRIPRPYWDQRIKQTKALGMNTVCLYVFWNAHEPRPDEFDFTGQNDLAEFVRLCQANGMNVILRPGPYVCAEWEMGGLPWWLLRKKDIRLREADPYFLERVDIFQKKVAEQLKGLTAPEGGPIIMVQVENEYGSYGEDKPYVATIRDMLRKNFGSDVQMFQCDWSSNFTLNGLDDLIWTMNFGTGADIDQQFAKLKELRPDSPLMCSEFWSGWFDKWGANHETRPAADMIAGIDEMLSKGISFSLYMTHGGTNWGHWAGANSPGFAPDVTSYDYDAPISEAGHYTPKYDALRQTLAKYAPGKLPKAPKEVPVMAVPEFSLTEVAPLMANLPEPVSSEEVLTMEDLDMGFGSVLYRTPLPSLPDGAILRFDGHDYAQVFVNGRYIGKLDRRVNERELRLPATASGDTLDILVEAMGRINFGRAIKDYKGITSKVLLTAMHDGRPFTCDLRDWQIYPLPDELEFYTSRTYAPINSLTDADGHRIPGIYRGTFNLKRTDDTFLDFSSWGKGLVYVNGHPLGRIWEIGPQQTLYAPGCWLRKGENEIVVFDVVGPRDVKVAGHKEPLLDMLQQTAPGAGDNERLAARLLDGAKTVAEGTAAAGNGWQTLPLAAPAIGRYLVVEALGTHDAKDADRVAIAELYALGTDGKRLSREPWTTVHADSEDTKGSNRTADKVYDLQESTYWQTAKHVPFPHYIMLDLGADETVSAIDVLPRAESGAPHSMAGYRIYLIPAAAAK